MQKEYCEPEDLLADESFLAPHVAKARDALGLSAFDGEEAAGRGLSAEARLAEARAWLTAR